MSATDSSTAGRLISVNRPERDHTKYLRGERLNFTIRML